MKMISYKPFYNTLFKKGLTEYHLIFKQGFSANTLHRIKKVEAKRTLLRRGTSVHNVSKLK